MPKISVRKAIKVDIKHIVKIHLDCLEKINSLFYPLKIIKEWRDEISEGNVKKQFNNSSWVVALNLENEIIGFGQFSLEEKEIFQINVSPENLRQGVGASVFNYIEKIFQKNKLKEINLNSTLNAVDFYLSLGFKTKGEIEYKLKTQSVRLVRMFKIMKR